MRKMWGLQRRGDSLQEMRKGVAEENIEEAETEEAEKGGGFGRRRLFEDGTQDHRPSLRTCAGNEGCDPRRDCVSPSRRCEWAAAEDFDSVRASFSSTGL